jgi:uncharacterized protein YjbJ (UPF0337 family)
MAGTADDWKGKAKEALGDLTEDEDLKREGKRDQAAGAVKDKVDDARDRIVDKIDDVKDTLNRQ